MGIIRPRHRSIGVISLLVAGHSCERQPEHLCQFLANLVFGHAVLGRELQDLGQFAQLVLRLDILDHDVTAHPCNILRVGGIPQCPVIHLDTCIFVLCLPHGIKQGVDGALRVVAGRAVQHRDTQDDTQPGVLGSF